MNPRILQRGERPVLHVAPCGTRDTDSRCIAKNSAGEYTIVRCDHVFSQGLDSICQYTWDDENAFAITGPEATLVCGHSSTVNPPIVCGSLKRATNIYFSDVSTLSRSNVPHVHGGVPPQDRIIYDRCMQWPRDIVPILCPFPCIVQAAFANHTFYTGTVVRPTTGFSSNPPVDQVSLYTTHPAPSATSFDKICLYSNITTINNDGILIVAPTGSHHIAMQIQQQSHCYWVSAVAMHSAQMIGFYADDSASIEGQCV